MKNRYVKLIIVLLIVIESITLFLLYKSLNNKVYKEELNITKNNMFAILIEQEDGSYKESSSWPNDNYIYNSNLSGCVDYSGNELNGALSFNEETKVATVNTITSTKCYLYFEIYGEAYALYTEDDQTLTFVRSKTPYKIGELYGNKVITNVYTGIETSTYDVDHIPWKNQRDNFRQVVFADEIKPISIIGWFQSLVNIASLDLEKLNTSNVTDMSFVFSGTGGNIKDTFKLTGLSNWDVSNVTDMSSMFQGAGGDAEYFYIESLSNWDTSNVTDMSLMFFGAGQNASTVDIGDLTGWDVREVINISGMFHSAFGSGLWSDFNLSNWKTKNVTNMSGLFSGCGNKSNNISLNLSGWDVSNVTDMSYMFSDFGGESFGSWNLDLSGWDVSNVTRMEHMFENAGRNASFWILSGSLSSWDVSNVTNVSYMFANAGKNNTTGNTLDLREWHNTGSGRFILSTSDAFKAFNLNVENKILAPTFEY